MALALVCTIGTFGYMLLGFSLLDAIYQTVITVTTVGYREIHDLSPVGKVFTIVLILVGVGTALYTFGVLLEALVEGHLRSHMEARRMKRDIDRLHDHVIICGMGRVGRAAAQYLASTGRQVVVVDRDGSRLEHTPYLRIIGDVTDDAVLEDAGIRRAAALIAALDTDADNVYVTLSSRALRPDLVIISRARDEGSKSKLTRAGADRAVNPQLIGGRRMASFALQRHVAEFVDLVLHDEALDYRMEQVEVYPGSQLSGVTLRDANLMYRTGGVLLPAIRDGVDGPFLANPSPTTTLTPGVILIGVGTSDQLAALRTLAAAP